MSGLVEFPQPEVIAPALFAKYYYAQCGHVIEGRWGHSSRQEGTEFDRIILELGAVYLTHEACKQRIAYDAQQKACLVMPAWWRKMGDEIEWKKHDGTWAALVGGASSFSPNDWSAIDPQNYRARARDVVRKIGGVEYRWPETVPQSAHAGDRYVVTIEGVIWEKNSLRYGSRTHFTRAGASIIAQVSP